MGGYKKGHFPFWKGLVNGQFESQKNHDHLATRIYGSLEKLKINQAGCFDLKFPSQERSPIVNLLFLIQGDFYFNCFDQFSVLKVYFTVLDHTLGRFAQNSTLL